MQISMKRFLFFLILTCLLMLPVMGCSPAEKPISDDQGVAFHLKQVEDRAAQGQWSNASDSLTRLEAAWKRDKGRLTSNRTRTNVNRFEASLKELKEDVRERDKEEVSKGIATLRRHYRNITSP